MSAQRNFTISTPVPNVRADAGGGAAIVYTVANTSGLPNRGLARVVPLGDTRAEWLALEGQLERDFPVGGIHQFTVSAKLPPGSPSGRHSLRLDILSARKGGEEAYAGPVVTIETASNAAPARASRWWIWAAAAILLLITGIAIALMLRSKDAGDEPPIAEVTDTVTTTALTETVAKDEPIAIDDRVAVPNLISTAVARAEWELDSAGLKSKRKDVIDTAATPGTVRMSSPRPGEKVAKGTVVELEVVIAADLVAVPDVVGTMGQSAIANIEKVGLVAASQNAIDYTRTVGTVIAQSPVGGTDVKRGTKVTVTVASGRW
ncbi:MAG: PASTA domain-containing protein [Thermoanaerobaculia bacterium]